MSAQGSIGRRRWDLTCVGLAIGVLVAFGVLVVIPAAKRPDTAGFAAYYTVSRILLTRPSELPLAWDDAWFQAQIDGFGFQHVPEIFRGQPPTMALIMAPIAWLSPLTARIVWTIFSVFAWVASVVLLVRALPWNKATLRSTLVVLALSTAYRPLRETIVQGQAYTLILLVLVAAIAMIARETRRASWLGGALLGGALVLKSGGAWLVLMLLLSRRWIAVLAAALTYASVLLLTLPLFGLETWRLFLHDLATLGSEPYRYVSAYQTVASLFGHLLTFDAKWSPQPALVAPALAAAMTLGVTVATAAQSFSFARRRPHDSHAAPLLRLALFDALVVTLNPVAEGYSYLLVLPAVVIAALFVWNEKRREPRWWLAVGVASLLLVAPQKLYSHPAIQAGWLALLAYPRVYGAFMLWGSLAMALTATRSQLRTEPS